MERALLDALQEHLRSPFMDTLMVFVTHLGDLAIVWFLAAAVLAARPQRRTYALAVVIAVLLAVAVGSLVLKPLFDRPRPFAAFEFLGLIVPAPGDASFPSNHSMVSFAAATALCCLPEKGRTVTAAKVAAVTLACLIAFSRLYLYVHYPTDVLVGALLGVALGFAAVALARRLRPDRSHPASP